MGTFHQKLKDQHSQSKRIRRDCPVHLFAAFFKNLWSSILVLAYWTAVDLSGLPICYLERITINHRYERIRCYQNVAFIQIANTVALVVYGSHCTCNVCRGGE